MRPTFPRSLLTFAPQAKPIWLHAHLKSIVRYSALGNQGTIFVWFNICFQWELLCGQSLCDQPIPPAMYSLRWSSKIKALCSFLLQKMKLLIDNKCTIFFSSRFQIPVWNPSLLHLSISTRSYWMSVSFYSMQFRFMSAVHANWTLIVFPDMMIQL